MVDSPVMPKPKQLANLRLLPPVEVLIERLQRVEADLAELEVKAGEALTDSERAGVNAHIAALSRKRMWYLSRIRSVRPVTPLNVEVAEEITTADKT